MEFTGAEVRFLSKGRGGWADISGMAIPEKSLRTILRARAKHLGEAFERFREANTKQPNGEVVPQELELVGLKLF